MALKSACDRSVPPITCICIHLDWALSHPDYRGHHRHRSPPWATEALPRTATPGPSGRAWHVSGGRQTCVPARPSTQKAHAGDSPGQRTAPRANQRASNKTNLSTCEGSHRKAKKQHSEALFYFRTSKHHSRTSARVQQYGPDRIGVDC